MARVDVSFNFGANVKPKKKPKGGKKSSSQKANAWQSYTTNRRRK